MSALENYQLFASDTCGFCARVKQFLQQRGIDMVFRDTLRDPAAYRELLQGGGEATAIETVGIFSVGHIHVDVLEAIKCFRQAKRYELVSKLYMLIFPALEAERSWGQRVLILSKRGSDSHRFDYPHLVNQVRSPAV